MTDLDGSRVQVPWGQTDVLRAAAFVVAGFIGILVLASVVIGTGVVDERTLRSPWFASSFHGALLLSVWGFGIRKYRARWSTLGLRRSLYPRAFGLPWLALFLSLSFTVAYVAVVDSFGVDSLTPSPPEGDILGGGLSRVVNVIVIVLWVPFAEEVFFRGFLLAALVKPLGAARAAVVSSLVFATGHLMLSALVPFFVTGLILAWLYLKTRSLWPPMTAHAAQNLLALSLST